MFYYIKCLNVYITLRGGRCRIMRKYWHIAGKGSIALIYKELSPINKRKRNICFFKKQTKDVSR